MSIAPLLSIRKKKRKKKDNRTVYLMFARGFN